MLRKPVFSLDAALDITIGDYVEKVPSMADAIERIERARRTLVHHVVADHVLLDPSSLTRSASQLDDLRLHLIHQRGNGHSDAERMMSEVRRDVSESLGLSRKFN